jgi:hypothetical protein
LSQDGLLISHLEMGGPNLLTLPSGPMRTLSSMLWIIGWTFGEFGGSLEVLLDREPIKEGVRNLEGGDCVNLGFGETDEGICFGS